MTATDQRRQLVDLFHEAGSAHHQAYSVTNGDDPDWPLWYAEYMQTRLNQVLGTALTRSELTYLLVLVEKERMAASAAAAWPDFYAEFFVGRYGGLAGHMPAAPRL
jgi:hypothetical protein